MREIQADIVAKNAEAQAALEAKELEKAKGLLDEVDALQDEFNLNERAEKSGKVKAVEAKVEEPAKVDGFKAMADVITHKEAASSAGLISGASAANGENYLIPEDVKVEINELRKSYVSAKNLVTVETTDALAGSVNYEAGAPAGLVEFTDGAEIAAEDAPKFRRIPFAIKHFGKLIPISRILLGAEKAGLLGYINRWFVRSAVLTENAAIFAKLKAGYESGVAKEVSGWKELKYSIAVDLDPSCLLNAVIVTNQSGFAALDAEEDFNGMPVLQPNPAHPTQKLFQGLPVHVFPDAQLPDVGGKHPMIYGDLKAACTFVEHKALEFATSEHFGFSKNQNYMRVIEGFDVMSTDTSAYIYANFGASEA
jgi:HK97 family phage major capsid protein